MGATAGELPKWRPTSTKKQQVRLVRDSGRSITEAPDELTGARRSAGDCYREAL